MEMVLDCTYDSQYIKIGRRGIRNDFSNRSFNLVEYEGSFVGYKFGSINKYLLHSLQETAVLRRLITEVISGTGEGEDIVEDVFDDGTVGGDPYAIIQLQQCAPPHPSDRHLPAVEHFSKSLSLETANHFSIVT